MKRFLLGLLVIITFPIWFPFSVIMRVGEWVEAGMDEANIRKEIAEKWKLNETASRGL